MKNETMKKWIIIILSYVVLIAALAAALRNNNRTEEKWKAAEANVKAYDQLLSETNDKNAAYQLTVDQLSNAKDSLLEKLDDTRKRLKVKDKNLKSVQYISSTFLRTDTITLNDTIFQETVREQPLKIDTVVGDTWFSMRLSIAYPSTFIVTPVVRSEKSIVVSTKRETVNPPKKCWLLRLFQKKHTVLNIDVIEKNPYIANQESRYVEIIR